MTREIFSLSLSIVIVLALPAMTFAQDREEELDSLRDRIQDSRERVTTHEADERELLDQLEEVDRRLSDTLRDRALAGEEFKAARRKIAELEPALEKAKKSLARTQEALSARAVALYRGGQLGPVRLLFSSASLPEMLGRANALRVLVRHDAELVSRLRSERDELAAVEAEASSALADKEDADKRLDLLAAQLKKERAGKGKILARVREDRTSERRLLLELEQAAQALEETIRTLGAQAESGTSVAAGFAGRRGQLQPPVRAAISERFGKVVDPEFKTTTFRSGIDFAAVAGAAVQAVAPGIVRFAGWFRGYGRIVIVDHGDGYHSISGHLDAIDVAVGNAVVEGETLGSVGETGSLGGPSLYFELRQDGQPIDPEPWLLDPRA